MKKILITGCGGMLGKAFFEHYSKNYVVKATDIDLNEKWLEYLDVRDYKNFKKQVKNFQPDYIFHLAALTDLEYCEKNKKNAYLTNDIGTKNAANLAKQFETSLLYISTAGIFDGKKKKYTEKDRPKPLSHYGLSKYYGEENVRKNLKKYFICRAGWMMGGGIKDKKFVAKIMKQILAGNKKIYAIKSLFGSPTYTHDFAKNVEELIIAKKYGTYHMACKGPNASRFDVAEQILKVCKLDKKITLIPVGTDFFKKNYFAPRPESERLIDEKLTKLGLNKMRSWKVCLNEYLKNEWINNH